MESTKIETEVTIYQAPLTLEESQAVNKFVDLIKSSKVDFDPDKYDSSYLIRFLRARKLDLNKAFEMFSQFLKWRADNNIDQIDKFEFPELEKMKVYYPHGLHKVDKLGRPVYIQVLGDLKVDELFKLTSNERLLMYQVKEYERLLSKVFPICSQSSKKHISQILSVVDLKKLTAKLLSSKVYGLMKISFQCLQNYYPEILGHLYIVNAGLIFKAAWSVCKAFLDEKTKKKIEIIGSDYKKKLLLSIDAENLPEFLGGQCKCPNGCIFSDVGPWNKSGEVEEISSEVLQQQIKLNADLDQDQDEGGSDNLAETDLEALENMKIEEEN